MKHHIALVTLVVRDYDEAIAFYVGRLGFKLLQDRWLGCEKRWVVVSPVGAIGTAILLAKADGQGQEAAVGHQAGGRVAFFLHTDDFDRDYASLTALGVLFTEAPRTEPYGKVAVFKDLYGNRWDLLQPTS